MSCGHALRPRLEVLRRTGTANAIDHIVVSDGDAATPELRQPTLIVQLLRPLPPTIHPQPWDLLIAGGDRFPEVGIEWVARGDSLPSSEALPGAVPKYLAEFDDPASTLVVRTSAADPSHGRGDHSRYRLSIRDAAGWGMDPLLGSAQFSFKVECPSPFDCDDDCVRREVWPHPPVIDYLAKDFESFRRLILDRLSVLIPGWTERLSPDLLLTLAELIAYRADQLSYRQDVIATNALLATARDRIALRRHARLLDYRVDDGVSARTYLRVEVSPREDGRSRAVELPTGLAVISARAERPVLGSADAATQSADRQRRAQILRDPDVVVFETAEPIVASSSLNELRFWNYGERDAVLPAGATHAALRDWHPALRPGDALLLAHTSRAAGMPGVIDLDSAQIVRLTTVADAHDPLGGRLDGGPNAPRRITLIGWAEDDALRSPLCLDDARAHGNLVLADHGRTMPAFTLPDVPPARLRHPATCAGPGDEIRERYRPRIPVESLAHVAVVADRVIARGKRPRRLSRAALRGWLTERGIRFAVDRPESLVVRGRLGAWSVSGGGRTVLLELDGSVLVAHEPAPAIAAAQVDALSVLPAIRVEHRSEHDAEPKIWRPAADLIGATSDDPFFVAETDSRGEVLLRFGDDHTGRAPEPGGVWTATYRDRGRTLGNVGRDSLRLIDAVDLDDSLRRRLSAISAVSNPLPAHGGTPGVSDAVIRRDAPHAAHAPRRAVTLADYAARAASTPGVQRAQATARWTGSWHTTALAIDPIGGGPLTAALEERVRAHVDRWRMAGGDLEIDGAIPVALDIALDVECDPAEIAAHVERRLRDRLGSGRDAEGRLGYFHPDRVSFGDDVPLSPLVAEAAHVRGVRRVTVTRFRRVDGDGTDRRVDGVIPLGRLEIARCDTNPDFPDRGLLELTMRGGR